MHDSFMKGRGISLGSKEKALCFFFFLGEGGPKGKLRYFQWVPFEATKAFETSSRIRIEGPIGERRVPA